MEHVQDHVFLSLPSGEAFSRPLFAVGGGWFTLTDENHTAAVCVFRTLFLKTRSVIFKNRAPGDRLLRKIYGKTHLLLMPLWRAT